MRHCLALVLLFLAYVASQQRRFVSTTAGNDEGNSCASFMEPCRTISRAVQAATDNDIVSVIPYLDFATQQHIIEWSCEPQIQLQKSLVLAPFFNSSNQLLGQTRAKVLCSCEAEFPYFFITASGISLQVQNFEFQNFSGSEIFGTPEFPTSYSYQIYFDNVGVFNSRSLARLRGSDLVVKVTNSDFADLQRNSIQVRTRSGASYVSVSDCTFKRCVDDFGGAFYVNNNNNQSPLANVTTEVEIKHSLFEDNSAGKFGGAISYSAVTVAKHHNVTFIRNSAGFSGGSVGCLKSEIMDFDSVVAMNNTSGSNGGNFYFQDTEIVSILNSQFIGNQAVGYGGGAVYAQTAIIVRVSGSTFIENKADGGGGMLVDTCEELFITDSDFIRSVAKDSEGGALSLHSIIKRTANGNEHGGYIERCKFIGNSANTQGGAISVKSQYVITVSNSQFAQNVAVKDGGGAIFLSGIALQNVAERDGESLILQETYGVTVKNCSFVGNSGKEGGGILSLSHLISMIVDNCTLHGNSAYNEGGGIFLITFSSAIINSHFESNFAPEGGCISSILSNYSIDGTTFMNCSATQAAGIKVRGTSIIMSNVTISNAAASKDAGGMLCSDASNCTINNSTFSGCSAKNGGGLAVTTRSMLRLNYCVFARNSAAVEGGALFLNSFKPISIVGGLHVRNSAQFGGAIGIPTLYDEGETELRIQAQQVTFRLNTAQTAGGLLFCHDNCPPISTWIAEGRIVSVASKADYYGNDYASAPSLFMLQSWGALGVENQYISIKFSNYTPTVYAGQYLDVMVSVIDKFQQTVKFYPNFNVRIDVAKSSQEMITLATTSDEIPIDSTKGELRFIDLQLFGKQNHISNATAMLSIYTTSGLVPPQEIPVKLVSCPAGFAFNASSKGNRDNIKCEECPQGSYTLVQDSETCIKCPDIAECFRDRVESHEGYYTILHTRLGEPYYPTATVHFCSNGKCSRKNECKDNRDSRYPLCAACLPGYSEWNDNCVKCDQPSPVYLLAYIAYIVCLFMFQHISCQSTKSAAPKIFFFFGQTLTLISTSAQYQFWFKSLFEFEISISFSFSNDDSIQQSRCPFPRTSYFKLLTNFIQPLILLFILLIFFMTALIIRLLMACIRKLKKRNKSPSNGVFNIELPPMEEEDDENNKTQQHTLETPGNTLQESLLEKPSRNTISKSFLLKTHSKLNKRLSLLKDKAHSGFYNIFLNSRAYLLSFSNLLIITYQSLAMVGFSFFACKRFGDNLYLYHSTDIQCFSGTYYNWMALYIIAALYGLFFPLAVLLFLLINRKRLRDPTFSGRFGVLYLHYKPKFFWFEAFSLYRRTGSILIVYISNAQLQDESPGLQYIVLALFLIFFLLVQRALHPYAQKSENRAEELSIFALLFVTFLRGSFAYEKGSKLAPTLILVCSGVMVVCLAIFVVLSNQITKNVLAKLKLKLQELWSKIRKGRNSKEVPNKQMFTTQDTQEPTSAFNILSSTGSATTNVVETEAEETIDDEQNIETLEAQLAQIKQMLSQSTVQNDDEP